MTSRADRLLCCAVAYTNAEVEEVPIPVINESTSVEDLIGSMMNVLWFEANQNMKEVITDVPPDPYLHAVDIDSSEPGIVSSKGKLDIHRRKLPVPKVVYKQREPIKLYNIMNDVPEMSIEDALEKASKEAAKKTSKAQRSATRDLKHEKESIEKIAKREEAKERRKNETPEERQQRLEESREKREKKKEEKKMKELQKELDATEKKEESIEVQKSLDKKPEEETNVDIQNIAINVQELLESEAAADAMVHCLLPQRIKAKNRKAKFYSSPVPFDRHLAALEACWPSQHVKEAFIDLIPSDKIKVIQGPPGTGKTTELVKQLEHYHDKRVFVCAGTNVGAANVYTRILRQGYSCSLLMPQSRIPPGTPITTQDPTNRIVCSTISGRSGPILDAHKFEVVLVDEAAQCMEAWFWGLIRPEVEDIVMVGDTAQLPALVSEKGQKLGHDRSLMQRLVESQYPYTFLNVQHRMHPEIVQLPNKWFYDDKLTTEYKELHLSHQPYTLYNVKGECNSIGTSFVNEIEARFCIEKATSLLKISEDVVILCPYQAQARQLLSFESNIPIHTIDSFQGREADIVVLSMVRTDECGFWSDTRRLCVALTRAKHVMCVVGNCESWKDPLKILYQDACERSVVE